MIGPSLVAVLAGPLLASNRPGLRFPALPEPTLNLNQTLIVMSSGTGETVSALAVFAGMTRRVSAQVSLPAALRRHCYLTVTIVGSDRSKVLPGLASTAGSTVAFCAVLLPSPQITVRPSVSTNVTS